MQTEPVTPSGDSNYPAQARSSARPAGEFAKVLRERIKASLPRDSATELPELVLEPPQVQAAMSDAGLRLVVSRPSLRTQDNRPPEKSSDFGVELPASKSFAARARSDDTYGWRALSRKLGDEVVGPGFGAIFERQIDQESGFDPAVAYGRRKSSAGAEGIAQLMPSSYPTVNRLDPQESLVVAAQTMRRNLQLFNGNLRMALAAYNAGVGAVSSLVQSYGTAWEEGLPSETQSYLRSILGS